MSCYDYLFYMWGCHEINNYTCHAVNVHDYSISSMSITCMCSDYYSGIDLMRHVVLNACLHVGLQIGEIHVPCRYTNNNNHHNDDDDVDDDDSACPMSITYIMSHLLLLRALCHVTFMFTCGVDVGIIKFKFVYRKLDIIASQ